MNRIWTRHVGLMCGTLLVILAAFTAGLAQEFRGTIAGTVNDPNGAGVPNATVTIRNIETNTANTVTTNEDGGYVLPLLQPGSYKVTVVGTGFKTSTRESVQVKVDDRITLDFQLEIGAAAEVTIVADTDIIERGSVTAGTSISRRQVEELPLAEGAPYVLATQAPGVVYTGDPNFTGPTANGNLAGFRTNGVAGNQINLDGSPNLAYSGQVAFTPPSDAVQEFKVQTNSFDAQSGFTAGGTVNVAIKSGTNRLHGTVYEYNRDKSRTANNFFNNRLGRERPDRKYDRYGVTVGGPVFFPNFGEGVPALYDGRDKTFFFFAAERQKDNVAQPTTYSVPTLKMRTGDFSELIVNPANIADPLNTVIYNPLTGTVAGQNRPTFGCPATGALPAGSLCNVIPANLIYQPSLAFLNLFPKPNQPGIQNNFVTDQNLIRPYRSFLAKIDHNFNSNNRMFVKWINSKNTEDRYNLEGTPDSITRGYEDRQNDGVNGDFTSIISSNLIFNMRGSWNRFRLNRYQTDQPTVADLGFTGFPAGRLGSIFPRFDFANYLTLGSLRADYNNGQDRPFDLYSFQPTVTQLFGNHSLKYGYDYRFLNEKFSTLGYTAGRFQFNGSFTSQSSNANATQTGRPGRDVASFLLGLPVASGSSFIDNPTEYDTSETYHGLFIHDDWRITPNVTINFGLRYELESGVREAQGRLVKGFNATAANPLAAQVLANYNAAVPLGVPITQFQNLKGGLEFVDGPDDPNQSTDKNNFQPRVGVSWGLNSKTVLRAGFGVFTSPFQIGTIYQPGFSSPTLFVPTTNSGQTFVATLANPFPSGIAPSPGSSGGLTTFLGRDVPGSNGAQGPTTAVLSYDRKNANYYRFLAGIQRELPGGIGVELTYLYSAGRDLAVNRDINAIPTQYLVNVTSSTDPSTIAGLITAANTFLNLNLNNAATVGLNPFRGLVPDNATYNSTSITRRRLLSPFPQFGALAVTEYNGTSTYQSLAVQLVKRFTEGLSLNASYTFSRERITAQYLNPQDTEMTEMISPNERPHRWTASAIYELPFGRSRRWGSDWHPVVNGIFGGWQVQGVYEWQSGEPLLLGNVYYAGDITQLKSRIGERDAEGRKYGVDIPAFDTSGFYINGVAPAFGNNFQSNTATTSAVLRNIPFSIDGLRNQRFLKFDVGVSKNFRIKEGMKFQVRVEAINALNSPYFSGIGLDPTATTAFGIVTTQRQPPRDIQIGGRFTF